MSRPSNRGAILDAAERVLMEKGAWRLTLDAVALEASVSKGGVLYHFPSKDQLLEGLVSRLLELAADRRRSGRGDASKDPAQVLRSEVEMSLLDKERNLRLGAAIVGALAHSPNLLDPVRAYHRDRFREVTSLPISEIESSIILLAVDGLMMLEILDISPFTPEVRAQLVESLLEKSSRMAAAS